MGKYVTKQRKILQDYLAKHIDQELSAKKVAEDLADQNVSLSAIYRNVADMEKEKLVVPCHKEGSREFYFRYIGAEDCMECIHITCKICNKTEHIPAEETLLIQNRVKSICSYTLDVQNTLFYGICKHCQTI